MYKVTRKALLKSGAARTPREVTDVVVGAVIAGVVSNVTSDGVFVRFLEGLTGRASACPPLCVCGHAQVQGCVHMLVGMRVHVQAREYAARVSVSGVHGLRICRYGCSYFGSRHSGCSKQQKHYKGCSLCLWQSISCCPQLTLNALPAKHWSMVAR